MSIEQLADDDFLIAEYTLGLLNLQGTSKAQALLGSSPDAVVAALRWEDQFLGLVDQLPPLQPAPQLLQRIQATLGQEITLIKRRRAWPGILKKAAGKIWNSLWLWRVACIALALAAVAFAFKPKLFILQVSPTQAAILQAPGQSSTPGWVATFDQHRNLVLKPLVRIDVPASSSVQLWTHATEEAPARSLGLIDPNRPVTVPAASIGEVRPGQLFEMTLEAKGGSPAGPTGPVLFIGRMVAIGQ